jgi:hypothetical protein
MRKSIAISTAALAAISVSHLARKSNKDPVFNNEIHVVNGKLVEYYKISGGVTGMILQNGASCGMFIKSTSDPEGLSEKQLNEILNQYMRMERLCMTIYDPDDRKKQDHLETTSLQMVRK